MRSFITPYFQAIDGDGRPVPYARVRIFDATTGADAPVFSDPEGTVAISEIVCDAAGRAQFYLKEGQYNIRIEDQTGAVVYTVSNYTHSGTTVATAGGEEIEPFKLVLTQAEAEALDTTPSIKPDYFENKVNTDIFEMKTEDNMNYKLSIKDGVYATPDAVQNAIDSALSTQNNYAKRIALSETMFDENGDLKTEYKESDIKFLGEQLGSGLTIDETSYTENDVTYKKKLLNVSRFYVSSVIGDDIADAYPVSVPEFGGLVSAPQTEDASGLFSTERTLGRVYFTHSFTCETNATTPDNKQAFEFSISIPAGIVGNSINADFIATHLNGMIYLDGNSSTIATQQYPNFGVPLGSKYVSDEYEGYKTSSSYDTGAWDEIDIRVQSVKKVSGGTLTIRLWGFAGKKAWARQTDDSYKKESLGGYKFRVIGYVELYEPATVVESSPDV